MARISTDNLHYNKETRTFSVEASDLRDGFDMYGNTVVNPKTGKMVDFTFSHADKDGSGEDTYGWNFTSYGPMETIKLLIIND